MGLSTESAEPFWVLDLGVSEIPRSGAVVPGRIYLTTREGSLYALGDR